MTKATSCKMLAKQQKRFYIGLPCSSWCSHFLASRLESGKKERTNRDKQKKQKQRLQTASPFLGPFLFVVQSIFSASFLYGRRERKRKVYVLLRNAFQHHKKPRSTDSRVDGVFFTTHVEKNICVYCQMKHEIFPPRFLQKPKIRKK